MKRKALPPEDLLNAKVIAELLEAVKREQPLVSVVVSTTLVETAMMSLLRAFFVEDTKTDKNGKTRTEKINMFGTNGTLESLAKCRDLAYCLGFISDQVWNNIEKI